MNYEKAYKDALKRAKKLYEQGTITESLSYVFPELRGSEDEKIRKSLIEMVHDTTGDELWVDYNIHKEDALAWLEKQGEQHSAIRWYDVSLIPQEMEELLVEWDSEDATWHEIAFYHADTKTFWNGTRQVENVTRWCYIDDIIEKQALKPKWSEEDEELLQHCCGAVAAADYYTLEDKEEMENWLKSLKQMLGGEE